MTERLLGLKDLQLASCWNYGVLQLLPRLLDENDDWKKPFSLTSNTFGANNKITYLQTFFAANHFYSIADSKLSSLLFKPFFALCLVVAKKNRITKSVHLLEVFFVVFTNSFLPSFWPLEGGSLVLNLKRLHHYEVQTCLLNGIGLEVNLSLSLYNST